MGNFRKISGRKISGQENMDGQLKKLGETLAEADAVIIGAGAGLSASAGFVYTGERFERYFYDFAEKYHFKDMYSGGFHPYDTLEEHWAYWSRYIYINRYMDAPKAVYDKLYELVKNKDYFVVTTNVDHCFQKAGFDKQRLFYTQGDYGLFQCGRPCHPQTYDNASVIREMVKAQGYVIDTDGTLILPEGASPKMAVPSDLVPHCPKCGEPMSMNLRADHTFVEDEGWHRAAGRYRDFLRRRQDGKMLFLEIGVGFNTPGIVKYSFWSMTSENPKAAYVCVNLGETCAPMEIRDRSICVDADIGKVLEQL
ncbi:MAG: Sir2 silent information regulator family NAD-dependent deacetylase [Lachnospiraceae bacterium]|nr:Sir2 silent information regulator family NAD-dependent deacetylase [Lachnospiraceae bacterium]